MTIKIESTLFGNKLLLFFFLNCEPFNCGDVWVFQVSALFYKDKAGMFFFMMNIMSSTYSILQNGAVSHLFNK